MAEVREQLDRPKLEVKDLLTLKSEVEDLKSKVKDLAKNLPLLVNGIASYAFWHGKDLYPPTLPLSVRQLHDLSLKLETTAGNRLQAAKSIVRQYPDGNLSRQPRAYAPGDGELEECFPGIQSCVDRFKIPGNGPDDNLHHVTPNTVEMLKKKWTTGVQNRNQASAATLANFLQTVEDFKDVGKAGYLIDDFTTYVCWYRILFGFEYTDIASQSEADQSQLLSNGALYVVRYLDGSI
ncbi:hypothetical protein C8R45DRAFT_1008985 [Mycena sanguinolenta]|nr:hypothetical protein C8R45DRAFT_1008985 [Mycena sanguinolenta]